MELVSGSFILDNLRGPESDIVVRVPFRDQSDGEDLLIYILIEHQSTIDSTMPFRLLLYMTQIWDTQRRQWESEGTPGKRAALAYGSTDCVLYRGQNMDCLAVA